MRRIALLMLALGLMAFTAKAKQLPPPVPTVPNAIQIRSLTPGGTYTSPLTISGLYSPDPLPTGYIRVSVVDAKGVEVYDELADVEAKGVWSSTVKVAPAGSYTVTAYIVYTSASDTVTINVK